MELRMHRYFKKNENIIRVKKYLAECSVGDWFVLYQMSKNMNKRLFFDFLTSLAQVSRSDVLQVSKLIVHTLTHTHTISLFLSQNSFQQQMTTQIRAVQAFKRSLKRSNKEKSKVEEATGEVTDTKELAVLCKSPLTFSQSAQTAGERRERRTVEDDIDYEVSRLECLYSINVLLAG